VTWTALRPVGRAALAQRPRLPPQAWRPEPLRRLTTSCSVPVSARPDPKRRREGREGRRRRLSRWDCCSCDAGRRREDDRSATLHAGPPHRARFFASTRMDERHRGSSDACQPGSFAGSQEGDADSARIFARQVVRSTRFITSFARSVVSAARSVDHSARWVAIFVRSFDLSAPSAASYVVAVDSVRTRRASWRVRAAHVDRFRVNFFRLTGWGWTCSRSDAVSHRRVGTRHRHGHRHLAGLQAGANRRVSRVQRTKVRIDERPALVLIIGKKSRDRCAKRSTVG
jgi:hypothetical protein